MINIRAAVIHHQPIVRLGLIAMVENRGFDVAISTPDVRSALRLMSTRPVSFALADVDHEETLESLPDLTKVTTVLAIGTNTALAFDALGCGARGFISSTKPVAEFTIAIQEVAMNNSFVSV